MASVKTSGSQLIQDTDGETTLATITDTGIYQLALDLNDVANGETVIARIKGECRSGDTERVFYQHSWANTQGPVVNKLSIPIPVAHGGGMVFSLETSGAGADITIPWAVYQLDA